MVTMSSQETRRTRRVDALSRDRIVAAALEILDAGGAGALTVRELGNSLSTGRGAIYHHVSSMEELVDAATDRVIERVTAGVTADDDPEVALRGLALGIFDAIDAHPWVGTQLSRQPLQPAVFRIWGSIGRHLRALGLDGQPLSDAGSALAGFILGATAQYAAGPRHLRDDEARREYLDSLAEAWMDHDSDGIVREAASRLRTHDDREQFLAGVNLFLTGVRNTARD